IKQASMTLVKMYMKRLTMELKSNRNSDRESSQDSLLLQGVHFAYRAHQFAGGLDSETLCAFEEIRQRVPGHLVGSRELLACIASS
ncbi:protein CHUP1, partial [Trifolium pratense]